MGKEPVAAGDRRPAIADYCHDIEAYLCKKNDGHLIRVVGPSFDIVSAWADRGVPLKVAFEGIDRYVERYYRSGPRRRPVKIDFCEADVLDVFDEWRRATGVAGGQTSAPDPRRQSLPAHLERVVTRLSSARASGILGPEFDGLIDRISIELDAARSKPGGLRGSPRAALETRLAEIDAQMLQAARAGLDSATLDAIGREAEEELSAFRGGMTSEAYARARNAAVARLVRQRCNLPTVVFD